MKAPQLIVVLAWMVASTCQPYAPPIGQSPQLRKSSKASAAEMQHKTPPFTGVTMEKGGSAKPAKSHGGIWSNHPNPSPNFGRQIDINCNSLVELLVRDPRGRKLGIEGKKQPAEIPGGIYAAFEGPVGNIFIPNPVWGLYRVSAVRSGYFPTDCVFFSYNAQTQASAFRLRHFFVIAGEQ